MNNFPIFSDLPPPPPEDVVGVVGHAGESGVPPNSKGGEVVCGYTTLGFPSMLKTALEITPEAVESPTTLIFGNA